MRVKLPKRLEASVERSCRTIAQRYGCKLLKIERRKGWPDRILMGPGVAGQAKICWVEFKREGETQNRLQRHIMKILENDGHQVLVVYTIDQFTEALRLVGVDI